MYAEIIVDIPAGQVNRPFDYLVPAELEDSIELGMRVEVNFSNRKLMGFVVGLKDSSDFAGKIRPINRLIDYHSYLNEELVELSRYLADYLQTFRVSLLQAMLPTMLKVKYKNYFIVKNKAFLAQVLSINESQIQDEYPKDQLEDLLPSKTIKDLIDQDVIQVDYRVFDQTTKRKTTYIYFNHTQAEYKKILENLSPNSHKQRQLITYIIDNNISEKIEINQLIALSGVTRANIKTAVDNGYLVQKREEEYRNPLADLDVKKTHPRQLTPQQDQAYKSVKEAIDSNRSQTFLLEGVTGSGKTEVYLQLIEQVRKQGKSALLLVPEISLTPQMVERVKGRFQTNLAVLHSNLTDTQRYDEWRRIIKGEAQIVVGARSSVFAPLANLGIIIIDEEHESSYKQSTNPRYHARDVAIWRSNYHSCPLVLGSATPSLESRARAEVDNYTHLLMNERVNQQPLPPVKLVDMSQLMVKETTNEISPILAEKIQDRLDRKEQIVLLLNRRGYSQYVMCRECGHVVGCPNCDISLTYHKIENTMKCHYCDYKEPLPHTCVSCMSKHIRRYGLGTQQVEETLLDMYPGVRITRMDNDTTRKRGQHRLLLDEFGKGHSDILLGTQMIAKGLDFPNVTLVGVINADTSLNISDFRAGEKTFQLLTQVSGRTGRGDLAGEVIVQTYNPNHYVMQLAKNHDYTGFFYSEMKRRHLTDYPPYYYTTLITVKSKSQSAAMERAWQIKNEISSPLLESNKELIILGPSQGPIAKINNEYYFQLLLKYKDKKDIQDQVKLVLEKSQVDGKKGIYVSIDHEPLQFI